MSVLPIPPHRFRFGLRTMFVVVTVVAVLCAWVAYSLNWIRERHHAIATGEVKVVRQNVRYSFLILTPVPRAPAGLWMFGEHGNRELLVDENMAEKAHRLFPEATIWRGVMTGSLKAFEVDIPFAPNP